ncbi:MAG: tetratricopeptide repeat protein [Chloroflexi bacterium]|nr:tetratricopeptide repeat protein [Chloroflexota bacterium]
MKDLLKTGQDRGIYKSVAAIVAILLAVILFTGCARMGCNREKPVSKEFSSRDGGKDGSNVNRPAPEGLTGPNSLEELKKGLAEGDVNIEKGWEILNPLLKRNPKDINLMVLQAGLTWQENKLEEALRLLDDILKKNPLNPEALDLKTRILLDQFRNREAMETANQLMKVDPGSYEYQLLKAKVMIKNKEYDQVEGLLKTLVNNYPVRIGAYLELAELYDASGQTDRGIEFVRKSLQGQWEDPNNVSLQGDRGIELNKKDQFSPKDKASLITRLGQFVEKQGNEEESSRLYQVAISLNPKDVKAQSRLSMTGVNPFDPIKMESHAKKAMEYNKDEPDPYVATALYQWNDEMFTDAYMTLYETMKKFPLEMRAYTQLGYFSYFIYQYKISQKAYSYANVLFPGDYDALFGLSRVDTVRRDFASAEERLAAASKKIPKHRYGEHYRKLGEMYLLHMRDYKKARENFLESMKYVNETGDLKDGPVMAMVFLGSIELRNNNYEGAEKQFKTALKTMPGDINIYTKIIYEILRNRKYDLADKYISEWEKLQTNMKIPILSLFYLRYAHIFMMQGELERAEKMIERAKISDPEDPMIYNRLGLLSLIKGDKEKAKEYYKKCIKGYHNESFSWFGLGLIAEEEGDKEEAERCYTEAAKLFRSTGDLDYQKAWFYAVRNKNDEAVKALKTSINKDAFNACRAYNEIAFDRIRNRPFFKNELPVLLKQVKDRTQLVAEDIKFKEEVRRNGSYAKPLSSGDKSD